MKKIISLLLCASIVLVHFSGCSNTKNDSSAVIEETRFLTDRNEINQVIIELPDFKDSNDDETIVFIKNFIQNKLEQLTEEKFDLSFTNEISDDVVSVYSDYYVYIKSDVKFSSEELVSIVFEGILNQKQAAHPIDLFFTLNYNPNTLEIISLSDIYFWDDSFYDIVIQFAEEKIKTQFGADWEMVYNSVLEQDLEKQAFLQGIKDSEIYYTYFTDTGLGISIPVPFALGDHIEIEISYNNIEHFKK